jgi:hypothetical protein
LAVVVALPMVLFAEASGRRFMQQQQINKCNCLQSQRCASLRQR